MRTLRFSIFMAGMLLTTACGPVINILEVDVKLPAKAPLEIIGKQMAVFIPEYDSILVTDSTLTRMFAESFAEQLAAVAGQPKGSVPLFSHKPDSLNPGFAQLPAYAQQLAVETESDLLFLVDSVSIGKFDALDVAGSAEGYKRQLLYVPFRGRVRVYDASKIEYTRNFPVCDTVAWELWVSKSRETLAIPTSAFEDLKNASLYIGKGLAEAFSDQWETQDRVIFTYEHPKWRQALEYADVFEWEKARDIWMELLNSQDPRSISCAAFNLAVSCEMTGNIDLAVKWLDYASKAYPMSEITYYKNLLEERSTEKKRFQTPIYQ